MSLRPASFVSERRKRLEEVLQAGLDKAEATGVRNTPDGQLNPAGPRGPAQMVPNPGYGWMWNTPGETAPLIPAERLKPPYERLLGDRAMWSALPKTMAEKGPGGIYRYERVFFRTGDQDVTDMALRYIDLDAGNPLGGRVEFAGEPGNERAVRWTNGDEFIQLAGERGTERADEYSINATSALKMPEAFPLEPRDPLGIAELSGLQAKVSIGLEAAHMVAERYTLLAENAGMGNIPEWWHRNPFPYYGENVMVVKQDGVRSLQLYSNGKGVQITVFVDATGDDTFIRVDSRFTRMYLERAGGEVRHTVALGPPKTQFSYVELTEYADAFKAETQSVLSTLRAQGVKTHYEAQRDRDTSLDDGPLVFLGKLGIGIYVFSYGIAFAIAGVLKLAQTLEEFSSPYRRDR